MKDNRIKPFRDTEQAEKSYLSLTKRYVRKIESAERFGDEKSVQNNKKKVCELKQKYTLRISATRRLEDNSATL